MLVNEIKIFTPEENGKIAEMLGWVRKEERSGFGNYFVAPNGKIYKGLPDFSLPEWTGFLLDHFCRTAPSSGVRFARTFVSLSVLIEKNCKLLKAFETDNTNRNLFDACVWIKENIKTEIQK